MSARLPSDAASGSTVQTLAERRAARAHWEVTVTRPATRSDASPASGALSDDHDDLYWTRVPVDERAALTWNLSKELYLLASRNGGVFDEATGTFTIVSEDDLERRLPRAAFVLTRR